MVTAHAMSEVELQNQIIDRAKTYKWWWWHDKDSRLNNSGLPDLILIRPPRLIFAELKRQRAHLRPAQKVCLQLLRQIPCIEVNVWRPIDLLNGTIDAEMQ